MFMQKLAVIIALSLSFCAAQTAATKPPEPESIGIYFYLDPATQTLKRLPMEDYKKHTGTGWTTVTDNVKIAGSASSFHISASDKIAFIFKASADEAERARLYRFTVKGDKREYELGKWKRRDFTPNRGIVVDIVKYGESSYKLTPETTLEPGEYALTMHENDRVFTFSVSAAGK